MENNQVEKPRRDTNRTDHLDRSVTGSQTTGSGYPGTLKNPGNPILG